MVAVFSAVNPRFFSLAAAANILQDFSPVVLMAIGQTFVIATAGIDISVGSLLGLSGVVMALVIRSLNDAGVDATMTIVAGLAAAVGVGIIVGLLNGLLITWARIIPFIATLAMMGATAGLTIVITGGVEVAGGPHAVILIGTRPISRRTDGAGDRRFPRHRHRLGLAVENPVRAVDLCDRIQSVRRAGRRDRRERA